jgi:predicted RNA-binding Zn-ribbon protein involved in translation (DUF1610 family)
MRTTPSKRAIVRDEYQRGFFAGIEIEQQVGDACTGGRVEVAGGLVGEQYRRMRDERACDGDALLFTTGELARVVTRARTETDAFECIACGASRITTTRKLQRQHHVLECRQCLHQMERLKDEPDACCAQTRPPVFVEARQIFARESHRAARR